MMVNEAKDALGSLQLIEQLIPQGQFSEAMHILATLEARNNLAPKDHFACQLLRHKMLIEQGDYQQSLALAEELLKTSELLGNQVLMVDAILSKLEMTKRFITIWNSSVAQRRELLDLINTGESILAVIPQLEPQETEKRLAILQWHKGNICRSLGNFDSSLQYLQRGLSFHEEKSNNNALAEVLIDISRTYHTKGLHERRLEHLEKSLKIYHEIDNEEGLAEIYIELSFCKYDMGELAEAHECFQKSCEKAEKLKLTPRLGSLFNWIGEFSYLKSGQSDLALKAFQRSFAIFKQFDHRRGMAWTALRQGNIHSYHKGQFNKGLECYKQSQELYEAVEDSYGIAAIHWLRGGCYYQRGDVDLALASFKRSLTIFEEFKLDLSLSYVFLGLGWVYQAKGDLDRAKGYFRRSLQIAEELKEIIENEWTVSQALQGLVMLSIDSDSLEDAQDYFRKLEQYWESKQHSQLVSQVYHLAKAMLVKSSPRMRDKVEAQEILQQLVDEEELFDGSFAIKTKAMLNLCELLLFEIKASKDETPGMRDLLQEAKTLIENLSSLAQKQPSFPLLIDAFVLQAKLALIEGDFNSATELLERAAITAEEKELQLLGEKVATEKKRLEDQYDSWQRLIQSNAPFHARLEQARLEEYLERALKTAHMDSS
jgi:tetratricopeptide (TPR) repeat protein